MTTQTLLRETCDIPSPYAAVTSKLALFSAMLVVAMLAIFVIEGIGQDPLQYIHSVQDYATFLLKNPPVLRASIGLDNLFIVFYSTMFLSLGITIWRDTSSKLMLSVALALMGLTGLLDILENMHFLSMIAIAVQGDEVGRTHIELQVWESLVKFHVSYLGLFLLGFAMTSATQLEKALCFVLRWIQLPVGLLIYLVPSEFAKPLVFGRFMFFFLAFLAIWWIFHPRKYGSNAQQLSPSKKPAYGAEDAIPTPDCL